MIVNKAGYFLGETWHCGRVGPLDSHDNMFLKNTRTLVGFVRSVIINARTFDNQPITVSTQIRKYLGFAKWGDWIVGDLAIEVVIVYVGYRYSGDPCRVQKNGLLEKTIILVGIYNQQFQGTIFV